MPRLSKRDKQLAEGLELEGYCERGTELCFEMLPAAQADEPRCVRCGSPIKYVMVTSKGPMGGDCYATLSGDNSTRAAFRKIMKAISNHLAWYDVRYFTLQESLSRPGEYTLWIKAMNPPDWDRRWYKKPIAFFNEDMYEIARAIILDEADAHNIVVYEES